MPSELEKVFLDVYSVEDGYTPSLENLFPDTDPDELRKIFRAADDAGADFDISEKAPLLRLMIAHNTALLNTRYMRSPRNARDRKITSYPIPFWQARLAQLTRLRLVSTTPET